MITQQVLKTYLHYNSGNGVFTWIKQRNRNKPGECIKAMSASWYLKVMLFGKTYLAHHLAFLYVTGVLHEGFIDHKDGVKKNNSWTNLRKCSKSQNGLNVKLKTTNTSGCKNVSFSKAKNRWRAGIRVLGKIKHIGYFEDLEFADLIATEARNKFHGCFANHG